MNMQFVSEHGSIFLAAGLILFFLVGLVIGGPLGRSFQREFDAWAARYVGRHQRNASNVAAPDGADLDEDRQRKS